MPGKILDGVVASTFGSLSGCGNRGEGRMLHSFRRAKAMLAVAAATGLIGLSTSARADTFGNNGGTVLSSAGSWINETLSPTHAAPPGSIDIARWDSASAGGTFTLGATTSWLGISIANPTAAVVIGATGDTANVLTLGASGIDMSAATQNLTLTDPITVGASQTWNVGTGRVLTTTTTTGTVGLGANTLTVSGAGSETLGAVVSGTGGSVIMNGTGTMTLSVANSFSGGLTVNSGQVTLNDKAAAGTGTITLNNGSALKFGVGLSSSNNYANAINVPSGATTTLFGNGGDQVNGSWTGSGTIVASFPSTATLSFTSINVLQNFTGTFSMGTSAGTLRYAGSNSSGNANSVALNLGTSTAVLNNRNSGTFTWGSIAGGSGTTIKGSDTSNAPSVYSIGSLGQTTTFAGKFVDGTPALANTAITLTGGTLILTGANTNTGATTITGGTLQIGDGVTTGSLGSGAITNNSALVYQPGTATPASVANAISGSGSFTHSGPGRTTLTGNNSFSGGTTITSGLLQANNATSALGTGAVTVSGGGIGGIGTVTAAVSVASGANVSPGELGVDHGGGTGVGTLTVNSLSLASGSILNYDFSSGNNDLVKVTGASGLSIAGGGINLFQNNTATPFDVNGTYNIFQLNAPYSGSVTNLLNVLDPVGASTYTWGTSGNFITLSIAGGIASSAWGNTGGGSWALASNWSGGLPNGAGSNATLGTNPPGITSPSVITLDGNTTIGNLVFKSSVGGASPSYTVSQGSGGSLILDNGANVANVTDSLGTHLISAPVVLNSNTAVSVINAADTLTISGPISGAGNLTASGSGTLVLSGANTYPGTTTINALTLQVGSGGTTGSLGVGAVTDNGILAFNRSNNFSVANAISGNGGVVKNGGGVVTLTGANSYSGTTTINTGALQLGGSGTLGGGPLSLGASGTLDLNGLNATATTLTGTGKVDNVAGGGASILTVGNASAFQFDGLITNTSGTVGLTKVGTGQLTISNPQSYTGPTLISAGSIKLLSASPLNSTGTITVNATQGLVLTNGVTLGNAIVASPGSNEFMDLPDANGSATLTGHITTTNQIRLGVSGFNSTINLAGSAFVDAVGSNILILTRGNVAMSNNAKMGVVGVNNFLLARAGGVTLSMANNSSVTAATADMGNNQATAGPLTITMQDNASFSVAGNFDLENASATLNSTSTEIDVNGNSTLAAGAFIKSKADAAHPAVINVDGGTIAANASSTTFMPALGNLSVFVLSGIKLDDRGHNVTIAEPLTGSGSGGLTKLGTGVVVLSGANSYTGATVVNAGTLEFTNAAAYGSTPSLTVATNGASGLDTSSVDPAFLGLLTASSTPSTGGLALSPVDAAVNIDFTAAPYSGPNIVGMSVGALPAGVTYTGTITPAAANYRLGGGGTLTLPNANALTGSNSATITNGGVVVLANSNNYTGGTTINAGSTLQLGNGTAPTGASNGSVIGTITDNGTLAFGSATNQTIGNLVTGSGGVNVNGAATAVMTPNSANTYTGTTTFTSGILSTNVIGPAGSPSGLGQSTANLVFNGGTLQYVGASPGTLDRGFILQGNGTIDSSGAGALTVQQGNTAGTAITGTQTLTLTGTNTGANAVNGVISNGLPASITALAKTGTGTWSLGGVNTYTGATTVSAGILNVPAGASLATASLTVAAGAMTNLNGTLTATPAVAANGALNVGANPTPGSGVLARKWGAVTLASTGTINIADSAAHTDRTVLVANSLGFAGTTGAWAGKLDLGGNDLVIHNTTAAIATATATATADQLKQGFNLANSGFWNGSAGIVSSTAAGDGTHLTTLGTILNNDGTGATIYSTFDGQTVANTDVLVKYTYFGDADLSGKVDGTDYSKIDNGFNNHLTSWFNGDFNYDGAVDGSDYSLIDNAFNTQGASLGSGTSFAASASSMVAGVASEVGGSSAVPEPGSLSLLGIGAVSLLARRRRKA